jgi:NADPH2:quinone reductase
MDVEGGGTIMKAFALDAFGESGALRDLPDPDPGEGQVRIRTAAAGVNPFDNAVVQGYLKDHMDHRFPLVPGMDASGTVDAVGDGVSAWAAGDEVFGSVGKMVLGEGTLAEFVTMSQGTIDRKPAKMEHTEAAAIPTAGVTALQMVEAAAISEGDVVVALGATGGVGSYLVQLAVQRGGRVVAVCSGENAQYASGLGARDVIDYAAGDVVEQIRAAYPGGIDVVADMHGDREVVAQLGERVGSGGHVISAVGAADVDTLQQRGIEATNIQGRVTTDTLDALASMIEKEKIQVPALRSFSLAEGTDALAAVGSGHTRGKIVVLLS